MSGAEAERKGSQRWLALALLCVAQFVDVLDVNAVIVALPSIGRELAGTRAVLLVARAAQGLGAAIVAPAALAIISTTFREGSERNLAMGVWTAVAAGGGAAGLVLGGLITDSLGWEWIFFVNVPVGAAGVALSFVLLEGDRGVEGSRRLDLLGATTVTAGLVVLVYGLTRAEEAGFGSPLTLGSLALAGTLIVAFVLVERGVDDPLVPLGIFRTRDLTGSAFVAFANTATTSPVGVLAVIYLQEVLAYSPTSAGLAGLPLSLSVVAGSFLGSRLTGSLGSRLTM